MQDTLNQFVDGLEVREPRVAGNVTVFPIFNHGGAAQDYRPLDEAIAADLASVEEKGSGAVPVLVLINRTDAYLLGVQGDELVGGKQNRILNISVLVPPKSVVDLPVSCVEQGRWHRVSRKFTPGEKAFPKLRRELHEQASLYLRTRGEAASDQGRVWDSVADELRASEASSPTHAMRDAYEKRRSTLDDLEQQLPYVEGASGLVCAVGGRISFAEVFGRPDACRRAWPRLVRSLAFEASGDMAPRVHLADEVLGFLREAKLARVERFASPGAGAELRLTASRFHGSALATDEAIVHCSLFANGAV